MNKFKILFLALSLSIFNGSVAQKLTVAEYSGINFSNINNSSITGKWKSMSGPVFGISAKYRLTTAFSLTSGVDYLSFYYNYNDYGGMVNGPMQIGIVDPWFYYPVEDWNFSYIRFPIIAGIETPGRLSYHFSVGFYYSLLTKQNPNHYEEKYPSNDYGYIFTHGASYTFDNHLKLNLDLKYSFGREVVIEKDNGRNAAAELCFGIGYTFGEKGNIEKKSRIEGDSVKNFLYLKYSAGAAMAFNVGDNKSNYEPGFGLNSGVSIIHHKVKGVSFEADLLYQRNSYWLKDSSVSYFYADTAQNMFYTETRTDLDYISIPVLINLRFGKNDGFYAGFGLYASVQLNARVVGNSYYTSRYDNILRTDKYHVYNSIDGNFYDYDAGWLFNLGFETPLFEKLKLDFNLRYNSSFVNIYKNEDDHLIKLKSLNLSAGIIIPII